MLNKITTDEMIRTLEKAETTDEAFADNLQYFSFEQKYYTHYGHDNFVHAYIPCSDGCVIFIYTEGDGFFAQKESIEVANEDDIETLNLFIKRKEDEFKSSIRNLTLASNTLKASINIEETEKPLNVIFFLDDNEYGYGFTHISDNDDTPYQSNKFQDRFSEEEILNEEFEAWLGMENPKMYVEEFSSHHEAVSDIINFWSNKINGIIDTSLNFKTAIEKGKKENLDYVIF